MKSLHSLWHRSLVRTLTLAWLESLAIRRDPVILAMILVVPTLQVVLFGYALRPLGGPAPVVISRLDQDPAELDLLEKSGDFRVVADGLSREEALTRLRRQEALLAIVVRPANALAGAAAVTVYADDSDPVRSNPALSKLEALYWRQVAETDAAASTEVRVERLYNPQSRNEWILTPPLSGVVVMISMLMLGALSIVRERERGTWEAMLSTPVNPLEAVVGKALPQWHELLVYALNRPLAFAVLELAARLGAIVRFPGVGHIVSDAALGRRVLTDPGCFDSHSPASLGVLVTQVLGPCALLNMDGPAHGELKRRLTGIFSPRYVDALLAGATDRIVAELQQNLRAGRTVDFVAFMRDFASAMACEMIGVAVDPAREREVYAEMFALATAFTSFAGLGKPRLAGRELVRGHEVAARLAAHVRFGYEWEGGERGR
jgi:hypothetical protein